MVRRAASAPSARQRTCSTPKIIGAAYGVAVDRDLEPRTGRPAPHLPPRRLNRTETQRMRSPCCLRTCSLPEPRRLAPAIAFPVTVKSCSEDVTFEKAPRTPDRQRRQHGPDDHRHGPAGPLRGRLASIAGVGCASLRLPEAIEKVQGAWPIPSRYPTMEAILGQNPDFYLRRVAATASRRRTASRPSASAAPRGSSRVRALRELHPNRAARAASRWRPCTRTSWRLGTIFGVEDRAEADGRGFPPAGRRTVTRTRVDEASATGRGSCTAATAAIPTARPGHERSGGHAEAPDASWPAA